MRRRRSFVFVRANKHSKSFQEVARGCSRIPRADLQRLQLSTSVAPTNREPLTGANLREEHKIAFLTFGLTNKKSRSDLFSSDRRCWLFRGGDLHVQSNANYCTRAFAAFTNEMAINKR